MILPKTRLIRVSKGTKEQIGYWKEGVSLHADSGRVIDELIGLVAVDRWGLGVEHRRQANELITAAKPLYRSR
ncbi:MAG TPA: hypothetical protein VI756_32125 [Blastocatellia bacterium]